MLLFIVGCFSTTTGICQKAQVVIEKATAVKFNSESITEGWINEHLKRESPKIILTKESLQGIKEAAKSDEAIKAYYHYLYKNAVGLLNVPVLERRMEGRRLLTVSREAVKRIGTLAIVYAMSNEPLFLDRVNEEMIAVSNFSDWNPGHFLDVGEMAYAVSIGLDWTAGSLPGSTIRLAKGALIDKALKPGLQESLTGWVSGTNNWNQVCHGGLSVAAIAVADEEPALAAQTIKRAVENIPNALKSYAPDGAYPEGASYWGYGTSYSLLTLSAFESAFGTDFGMAASPGFLESALFVKMLASPAGLYFNYFDSGSSGTASLERQELFSWFANKAGNSAYFDKALLVKTVNAASATSLSKLNGAVLTWMVKANSGTAKSFPTAWKGDGINPVVIFRSSPDDSSGFFLGAKGGKASLSHGDMDAGSFVFDLHGVRWSVDLGMPNYTELEAVLGVGGLWDMKQGSKRWTLMGKNNFGHSTLTINDGLHLSTGFAPLTHFTGSGKNPEAQFDLTEVFGPALKSAKRKFTKLSAKRLQIEDALELSDSTKTVTWAMMTGAEATVVNGNVVLTQNNKMLKVLLRQPQKAEVKIVSLDPPPLPYDMKVKGLKRLEFKWPAALLKESGSRIIVELSGE